MSKNKKKLYEQSGKEISLPDCLIKKLFIP